VRTSNSLITNSSLVMCLYFTMQFTQLVALVISCHMTLHLTQFGWYSGSFSVVKFFPVFVARLTVTYLSELLS
jgi:hypothetical protein